MNKNYVKVETSHVKCHIFNNFDKDGYYVKEWKLLLSKNIRILKTKAPYCSDLDPEDAFKRYGISIINWCAGTLTYPYYEPPSNKRNII